jgi:hypothetical protein
MNSQSDASSNTAPGSHSQPGTFIVRLNCGEDSYASPGHLSHSGLRFVLRAWECYLQSITVETVDFAQ